MASHPSEVDIFVAARPAQSAQQLMRANGDMFIRWAFITLVNRPAGADDLALYRRCLEEGTPKISVLHRIRRLPEARRNRRHLPGLESLLWRNRIKRAPVVGRVYRWLIATPPVKRLPPPSN